MAIKHYSVMPKELINSLDIKSNGIYVDCTCGLGGHSKLILEKLKKGTLIAFDQDKQVLKLATENLKKYKNVKFINSNFRNIKDELKKLNIEKVDGIIFDLGTSYIQLTEQDRGFTYHGEATLDMRMSQDQKVDAKHILNNYSQSQLEKILLEYGDEKLYKKLAKAIIDYRKNNSITTNIQLNEIIKAVKGWDKDKHPSRNVYQAIRIEVNDEINSLKEGLKQSLDLIKVNGKISVITFHSLEDKTVKDLFWKAKQEKIETVKKTMFKYQTHKTIYPGTDELEENNASRSAKIRTIKKLYE